MTNIPGYLYGSPTLARSPMPLSDFELLKRTVLFTEEDVRALRASADVLADQVEAILDVWYGFVGSNPHLLAAFCGSDGKPDADYLAKVRRRFGQWILDTARLPYDQRWLDWQHEIGLRHHRSKKNRTDGAHAAEIVPFRYLMALVYPITATLRPFLAKKGHAPEEVERMHEAWVKSVLLQAILWSRPYVNARDF
jgi:hypothetical protein